MTFFYFLLILHILIGLACASLVRRTGASSESWFVAGTLLGGIGLVLCWLNVSGLKRTKTSTHLRTS